MSPEDKIGMPLGISEEYDDLPQTGQEYDRTCQLCWNLYPDTMRLMPGGGTGIAVLCPGCRAKSRKAWHENHPTQLPFAIARYRS